MKKIVSALVASLLCSAVYASPTGGPATSPPSGSFGSQTILGQLYINTASAPKTYSTVGFIQNAVNTSTAVGYGMRNNYFSNATAAGFDLAGGDIAIASSTNITGTSFMAHWYVQVSPNDQTHNWSALGGELNPVNRGVDTGWTSTRGVNNEWTGGWQVVGESQTFGAGGNTYNILFGYGTAASGATNQLGKYIKMYNGLLIEQNSIAPGGMGVYAGGDTLGVSGDYPYSPFQAGSTWSHGLYTANATFVDNNALVAASSQYIQFGTSSPARLGANGTALTSAGPVQLAAYTVATLPTCNSGTAGEVAYVTDANAPTYNATLTGSSTTKTLAMCNGTNWTAH